VAHSQGILLGVGVVLEAYQVPLSGSFNVEMRSEIGFSEHSGMPSGDRPHCGQPTGSKTRPRMKICDRVKVHFTIARFTGRSFVAQDYRES